jgi:outer membrane receptor protein involved in Fe transport
VLVDGVPLNSPFGSWVYWQRLPEVGIQGVTVTNGAASDVYGSGALGGVINIETRQIEESSFDAELSAGSESTATVSVIGGTVVHNFGITASAQALRTGGYILVPLSDRGAIDTPAGTSDISGYVAVARKLHNGGRAFVRANSFGESRKNGTPLQINDTRIWSIDLGFDRRVAGVGNFSTRVYGSGEMFNQNFSAIATDRNSEALTNRQRNPSQQLGLAFQWQRLFAARHLVIAGFEARDVRGHSAETTFNASRLSAHLDAGGRQATFAGFAQDSVHAHGWLVTLGGRVDRWSNSGFSNRLPVTGLPTLATFPDRVETAFSPRASVSRTFRSGVFVTASFYRAFRAPTLNELYRAFRVGSVVTNANSDLRAERLTGIEGGLAFHPLSERMTLRGNFFWSQIKDPVANVTISSTANLITRQRQNLGTVRARGVEASMTFRLADGLSVAAQYLLTDTTVLQFPVSRTLEGLLVPQIPRHQFGFQVTYEENRWIAGVQSRLVGTQFDDDQNLLPLHRFLTIDAQVSRRISHQVEIYFAAQNLTAVRYDVGRTPVLTTGPPALLRLGVRVALR